MRTMNHAAFAAPSLDQLSREVDRLLGSMFQGTPDAPQRTAFPPLNLWEQQQNIIIEAELPGVAMEDLELTIHGDQLSLRGERKTSGPGTPLRRERWTGKFERTLTIPVDVDSERVSASLENGVLTITLPKAASAQPRRIQINTGKQPQ